MTKSKNVIHNHTKDVLTSGIKYCNKCKRWLPLTEYYLYQKSNDGKQAKCKACQGNIDAIYKAEHYDERHLIIERSYLKHRDRFIWQQLKRRISKNGGGIFSKDEFHEWYIKTPKRCIYCGISNQQAKLLFNHHLHIDRKDPFKGYTLDNIGYACMRCNLIKNKFLTYNEMIEIAHKYIVPKLSQQVEKE